MNLCNFCNMTSVFGLLGLVALSPSTALAQSKDDGASRGDEIVVTAQRRDEASVDVPITVASLSESQLKTANITSLSDISKIAPGLRFDSSGAFFQPTIRGVGTAVTTAGAQGNVGIYIDGFYSPNPLSSDFQLMKLKSIQVLKGPQGTLFGRNTTGGAILVQSADPSTTPEAEAKISYGRYNELRGQAYVTFGLTDKIAMDVEGMYSRGDGWRRNISNNQRVGDYENWSARVGLKAELSDAISVLLRYEHGSTNDPSPLLAASYTESVPSSKLLPFTISSGAPFYAVPGQFTFNPNEIASGSNPNDQEFLRSKSDVFQATIKADLGFADLTSYSQYRKEKVDASQELDYSGVEAAQLGLPNDNETWSQEFLLSSKPGPKLQWTLGLFAFSNRDTYIDYFDYAPNFPAFLGGPFLKRSEASRFGSSATSRSLAAFVDATYEVSPKLFVTAGVRYANDKQADLYSTPFFPRVRYDATAADYAAVNKSHVTPRAVIRFKPSDESSIYASYSKGYKAGILDPGAGGAIPVNPESINAFEVGYKFDNRRLSVELAGFYYDYKDLQVSRYEFGVAHIVNAAQSKIYGLDAQLRYNVSDHFQVNMAGAWVHGRYKAFSKAPVYTPCLTLPTAFDPPAATNGFAGGCALAGTSFPAVLTNLSDVTMQRTPEFTGNIGARYKTEVSGGELTLSGNLSYTSKFYFGPSGIQFPQKAYESLSLRAQWTDPSEHYTIAVWGDNVTNNRHMTAVQYAESGIGANWNKPVTYGLELGMKF